jgi:hypothetical protein
MLQRADIAHLGVEGGQELTGKKRKEKGNNVEKKNVTENEETHQVGDAGLELLEVDLVAALPGQQLHRALLQVTVQLERGTLGFNKEEEKMKKT